MTFSRLLSAAMNAPTTPTRYPRQHLAACLLPWTESWQLDVPAFERHVAVTLDGGHRCLYVMGTAGEGYAVSDDQFRQVINIFAALAARDGIDPQVGGIALSLVQILERIAFAYVPRPFPPLGAGLSAAAFDDDAGTIPAIGRHGFRATAISWDRR